MKARHNEHANRRKKISLRIFLIILISLIPIFFTGFIVGKSYAANEKNNKQDMSEKIETPASKDKEPSSSGNQQDAAENLAPPIKQNQEHAEKQAGAEEKPLEKVVYLTFDDGPSQLTNQFLDVLHEQDVKATFFMQGSNLKKEHLKESTKRATKEGHYIGAHSMTHDFNTLYKDYQFVPEMKETLSLIHELTGEKPTLVRAPYGSAPGLKSEDIRNQIVDEGIKVWDWTIDSNDWALKDNPTQIIENIKNGTKTDREVVLLHEKPQTLAALPEIIAFYKELGYEFVVYDEANHFDLNFQNDERL